MKINWPEVVGSRIRRARTIRGLSLQGLSDQNGWLTRTRISNYEQALREPGRDEIASLAKTLDVPVLWLGAYDLLLDPDVREIHYKYLSTDQRGRKQIHSTADAQPPSDQIFPWLDETGTGS